MENTLKNDMLSLTASPLGAELTSIQKDGMEYLWQADPEIWGRHAPVLFPIVGRLKNGSYRYEGKTYQLSGHGFARDMTFEHLSTTADTLIYQLTDTADTLKVYPFKFVLQIQYHLEGNRITVTYKVKNIDTKTLYFSIGAHPAFRVPLEKGSYEDYCLTVKPSLSREKLSISKKTGLTALSKKKEVSVSALPLTHELFKDDALVYTTEGKTEILLSNTKDKRSMRVSWSDMPYFGLWSQYPKEGSFVCIEPWSGLADDEDATGDLAHKTGINALSPQDTFQKSYTIEVN